MPGVEDMQFAEMECERRTAKVTDRDCIRRLIAAVFAWSELLDLTSHGNRISGERAAQCNSECHHKRRLLTPAPDLLPSKRGFCLGNSGSDEKVAYFVVSAAELWLAAPADEPFKYLSNQAVVRVSASIWSSRLAKPCPSLG